jgi:hypothetical protein
METMGMKEEEVKLCKDCKWYKYDCDCQNSKSKKIDLVNGDITYQSCYTMRMPFCLCDINGKFWEAKEKI